MELSLPPAAVVGVGVGGGGRAVHRRAGVGGAEGERWGGGGGRWGWRESDVWWLTRSRSGEGRGSSLRSE